MVPIKISLSGIFDVFRLSKSTLMKISYKYFTFYYFKFKVNSCVDNYVVKYLLNKNSYLYYEKIILIVDDYPNLLPSVPL